MWRRHLTLSTAEVRREWTCISTPPYSFTSCTGTSLPRTCYVINICVAISYSSRMSNKVTEFYLYSFLTGVTKLFNKACISILRYGNRTQAGAKFSASVQTGIRAHSASYTIGTGSTLYDAVTMFARNKPGDVSWTCRSTNNTHRSHRVVYLHNTSTLRW